jgi:4-carboxymuconolactone decarboxylase
VARVSLIEEEEHAELAELIGRIRSGRRGELLNVYKLLLHAPPLAATWFEHLNAVRWKTQLDGRLREIVIVRVAHLNRIAYVLRQHVPSLAAAEGLSQEECDALGNWKGAPFFDERERAALALADAMTEGADVSDAQFAEVRRHFSERQAVELAVLIGTYLMHNRVFGALRIDLERAR